MSELNPVRRHAHEAAKQAAMEAVRDLPDTKQRLKAFKEMYEGVFRTVQGTLVHQS